MTEIIAIAKLSGLSRCAFLVVTGIWYWNTDEHKWSPYLNMGSIESSLDEGLKEQVVQALQDWYKHGAPLPINCSW